MEAKPPIDMSYKSIESSYRERHREAHREGRVKR
jgi:hypothetical protein